MQNRSQNQKTSDERHTGAFQTPSKALFLAAGTASGVLEASVFHPWDTIATRLQISKEKIYLKDKSFSKGVTRFNQIVFQEAHHKNFTSKLISLYHGVIYAGAYKILQRTYKFGGQPIAVQYVDHYSGEYFRKYFGDKKGKILIEATTGSLLGVGEVIFLPLDNIKTKFQNQKIHYQKLGIGNLIKQEHIHLYNGTVVTLARNVPGSFVSFGVASFIKESVFEIKNQSDATVSQNFTASFAGITSAIVVTNFADVIKTRVQSHQGSVSTVSIFKDTLKKEGVSAFFKGTSIRLCTIAPKLTFSWTVAQSLPTLWTRLHEKKEMTKNDHETIKNNPPRLK